MAHSQYTKVTNFANKDTLPVGDTNKKVKGSEFEAEFNLIATAIDAKSDLTSPTFTGTPLAPTATVGTNTTQIATTAFVQAELADNSEGFITSIAAAYPVGSIYINASVATNPATLLGFGTWEAFAAGKVLVGLDSADTDFDVAEETGGAKTHTLTVDEMPSHTHSSDNTRTGSNSADPGSNFYASSGDTGQYGSVNINATGGGQAHNNLQPYIVVYMWKRTA